MAKLFFPLSLAAVLLSALLCTVSGVTLDQLFAVQSGGSNGGCDKYFNQASKDGTLDDWLEEINFSLAVAVDKIDVDEYNQDIRIRRALRTFFGVPNRGKATGNTAAMIEKIASNLKSVHDFFDLATIPNGPAAGQPIYALTGNRYLFCGSDFLMQQTDDTQARDWQARDITNAEGQPVTIAQVPAYAAALDEDPDNAVWWSGDRTDVNGYYFSTTGGKYCDGDNLGLTAMITELEPDGAGSATARANPIESIILCDHSFTTGDRPASYRAGDALIAVDTNLATVVPRSATLLHEAFHMLFGAGPTGFLQGDEIYDFAQVVALALTNGQDKSMRNPESYVFFVTHMYYLFGEPDGNSAASIDTNWDFALRTVAGTRIYAAKVPE